MNTQIEEAAGKDADEINRLLLNFQSQEQEVKAVGDAESEGWDMKHKPKRELENTGALIKRFGEVIVERDKIKKELEQEQFNHVNTRRCWDITLQERDKLKAALQPEAKKTTEQIAAYVHEIDSLRETNRKLGEKIAELQKEIDEKNKEICDLLDWGNGKDAELDRLEAKIKELENDYMQVQTNQQLAQFEKEERK